MREERCQIILTKEGLERTLNASQGKSGEFEESLG